MQALTYIYEFNVGKNNHRLVFAKRSRSFEGYRQFIQETRLQQNKTQQQVAEAAGINRSTVRQIEKGNGGNLISLLQILRVLNQLPILSVFETRLKISPLQIAKLEQHKRQRARNDYTPNTNW